MPTFDDILKEAGEFGRYQQRIFLLLCLTGTTFAFMFVAIVFTAYTPNHWCRSRGVDNVRQRCNWSMEYEWSYTIPTDDTLSNPPPAYSHCLRYDINWSNPIFNCSYFTFNSTYKNITTVGCTDGWDYEGPRSSIVTEFNLVCHDDWKKDLTQAMLNVGFLIGAVIIGYGADRFGRKPCYLISCFGIGLSGIIVTFAPNFHVLVIFYTLQGMFGKGAWITCYVMVTELVGSNYRRVVGIVAQIFFTFGVMVLPGIAYLIQTWRWLHLALILPNFFFLVYYWLIPESPRWLLNRQRTEEAMKIARKIAQQNGLFISDSYTEIIKAEESTEEVSNPSFIDLVRTPQMRKHTLILMYAWFTSAVVYQGLVMRLGIVAGGNLYLDFFISGAVELPAALIILFTIDRVGRRLPFGIANIVAGVTCLIVAFIPQDILWFKTTVATIGRLAITMAFEMVYLVNTELYPTPLRNFGTSVCSSLCDFGGIVAPFLLFRLANIWMELPMIIYGVVSLLCGVLVMFLPETKGIPLPETVEDVENIASFRNRTKRSNGMPTHSNKCI